MEQISQLWAEHFQPQSPQLDWREFEPQTDIFRRVATLTAVPSQEPVFEGHCGLTDYQWTQDGKNKPVFLFDNHNWALLALWELTKFCGRALPLVHIDAHRDDAICPQTLPAALTFDNIVATTERCRVSDYLNVATRMGVISSITSLTQSFEFADFILPARPFVLNLDLDIYGEEGSCVELAAKTAAIAQAWAAADAVLLATSPGWLGQERAAELVSIFTR